MDHFDPLLFLLVYRRIGELVPAKPPEDREQGRSGKKNQAEERHDLSIPYQRLSEFRKLTEIPI